MKRDNPKPGEMLDRIASSIREEPVDRARLDEAAQRVRENLAREGAALSRGESPEDCDGFQSWIPAYLEGTLSVARHGSFENHRRGCVTCHRALVAAREGDKARAGEKRRAPVWPRALAASLALAFVLGSAWIARQYGTPDALAQVEAVGGSLYQVSHVQNTLLPGAELGQGEPIRTSRGGWALLRLADGSQIELTERTELELDARRGGTTIRLARGHIIVQAAEQREGHLNVATSDCLVSVKGTVFAVNRGTKGSRVTVIEGKVELNDGRQGRVMAAGEQHSTHPSLGPVPVAEEIAWSQRLDEHLALLGELTALERDIVKQVSQPEPRSSSHLLDLLPEETAVYAAVPNLSGSLSDAYRLFRARLETSPVLRAWWEESHGDEAAARLDEAFESLREMGDTLGEELVFSIQMDGEGRPSEHLLLAETADPSRLRSLLDDAVRRLHGEAGKQGLVRILDEPPSASAGEEVSAANLYVWLHDGTLAASADLGTLQALETALSQGQAGLQSGSFRARIQEAYSEGVSWLVAADLESIRARRFSGELSEGQRKEYALYEKTGFADVQHLVLTQQDAQDQSQRTALVTFERPRRGLAAWLAPPAPMASLEFLSPDAAFVSAFVVKDTHAMLDDLFALIEQLVPDFHQRRHELETELGLSLDEELAELVGGEIAIAVDGPLLPIPSWKLVLEVYDPKGLARSFERLAEHADREWRARGGRGLTLRRDSVAGLDYWALRRDSGLGVGLHYTFVDGYMVMAPTRGLLDHAVRHHDTGINLANSPDFTALFPEDGHANFSAIVYQDLASELSWVADILAGSQGALTPEQQQAIHQLSEDAPATLFAGYAGEDEIRFEGQGTGGLFGGELGVLLRIGGVVGLERLLDHQQRAQAEAEAAREASTP